MLISPDISPSSIMEINKIIVIECLYKRYWYLQLQILGYRLQRSWVPFILEPNLLRHLPQCKMCGQEIGDYHSLSAAYDLLHVSDKTLSLTLSKIFLVTEEILLTNQRTLSRWMNFATCVYSGKSNCLVLVKYLKFLWNQSKAVVSLDKNAQNLDRIWIQSD